MVTTLKAQITHAFDSAARSPMITPLPASRPAVSFLSFVALACLFIVLTMAAVATIHFLVPGLSDWLDVPTALPDTPTRLLAESFQSISLALILGGCALGILGAAAAAWRRRLTDFLWPQRPLSLSQLGIGFILMFTISAAWVPIDLLTGSKWAPPILDPYYHLDTRILYVAVMMGALLAAAAAEEVVFRGVLLRVTGLVFKQPLLLCIINGMLFSAIHLDPDPVSFVIRAISGMGWTWVALRLGGLEFAIGAHFANNFYIAMVWAPLSDVANVRESSWLEVVPELIITFAMIGFVEWMIQRRDPNRSAPAFRPSA